LVGCLGSVSVSGKEESTRIYMVRLFLFSYSVNVILVYLFAYYFVYSGGSPFIPEIGHRNPDDIKYYNVGVELARQWRGEVSPFLEDPAMDFKYKGYAYFSAALYYISSYFGDFSPLIPRLVNSLFGGMVIALVFRIAQLVYESRVAYVAALVALFFPVWNYYSSMGLRDIVVAYFICLFSYSVLSFSERSKIKPSILLGLFLSLAGLYYFRTPIVWVGMLSALLYFVLSIRDGFIKTSVVLMGAVLYAGAVFYGWVPGKDVFISMMDQAERWGGWRSSVVSTESLAIKYIYQAPTVLYIPLIVLYTAAMPVPPIEGFMMHHFFVGIGALTWYFYIPFWVYAMLASFKYSRATFLTIFTVFLFIGIAVIQPDIRHKTQFFGLAMAQIAYSLVYLHKSRNVIITSVGVLGALLGVLYIILKI